MNETLRAFIAIEIPFDVIEHLRGLITKIRPQEHENLRTVHPESIHLTLKFLGDIEQSQTTSITQAMVSACVKREPFKLRMSGTGFFPNKITPRVLWVGVDGQTENLTNLQQSVEMSLASLSIPPENRSFNPHLTLARIRKNISNEQWQAVNLSLATNPVNEKLEIQVHSISLMQSSLTNDGATYDRIASVPFSL